MKIKAMIAEDERLVREELAYLLQQEQDFLLCPSAENGRQLLELFHQYKPDVIFLDIHMPSLSGTEVAKQLKYDLAEENTKGPMFVFTTAYDEYAVEAFELEAVDYLLKPYDLQRFKEALARIRKRFINMEHDETSRKESEVAPANVPVLQRAISSKLLIEDGEKMVVITPLSICFATKSERFTEIYTESQMIQTKMTLQELEDQLHGLPFFRPHRSYLVNLDYIQEITPWFNGAYNIVLKNKEKTQIPVSRSAAKQLFEILKK